MRAARAQGNRVHFWCPGCDEAHGITYGARDAWTWNGDLERPTFSPSVLVQGPPGTRCHSFVTDGRIQYLGDCEHALAGQTVDLPEWPYSKEN